MLKILLKKQLLEVNRSLFVNQKTGKAHSKAKVAVSITLYILLVVGILGGMLGFFGSQICKPLVEMGFDWLYFLLFAFVGLLLGIFGSVFNTYGTLYAAKDNDLLLSMPIPVRSVIVSRMATIFILGIGFSAMAFLPGLVVYLIYFPFNVEILIGNLIALLCLGMISTVISLLLGLLIARIATKIKSKTFISVIATLAFIVIYYVFYFRAQDFVMNIVDQAGSLALSVQGSHEIIYNFGLMCIGDWFAIAKYLIGCAVALVIVIRLIARNFIKLATSEASSKKKDTRLKSIKVKSVNKAIFLKEKDRFLSSSQYILNCGLGLILIPALGVFLLFKGNALLNEFGFDVTGDMGTIVVGAIAALWMLASMIDPAAPSVSLEGPTHWISQSLPVDPWLFLKGKMNLQLVLSAVPMLFTQICIIVVLKLSLIYTLVLLVLPQLYLLFMGLFDITLGVFNAKYKWTNEVYPIKQSMSVTIALFSGWIFAAALVALNFLIENTLLYMGAWAVGLIIASVILYKLLRTKGVARYLE